MEHNSVWIDGDRYYLTVPREDFLEHMLDFENVLNEDEIAAYLDKPFAVVTNKKDIRPFFGSNSYLPFDPDGDYPGQQRMPPKNQVVFFQPCLMPLTRLGDLEKRFLEEMPNGSIVEGGSFLIGGEEMAGIPHALTVTPDEISISDTGDRPIQWLWFDGMIFALNAGVYIKAGDLYEWLLEEL